MNRTDAFEVTALSVAGIILNRNAYSDPTIEGQKRTHPKIDDIVCHYLDGEALKEALFIIDNIIEHNMKIKWSSVNVWTVEYKRKHVCDLTIQNGVLNIGKVNDVLATRVKNMTHDRESLIELIEALRNSIKEPQTANLALQ